MFSTRNFHIGCRHITYSRVRIIAPHLRLLFFKNIRLFQPFLSIIYDKNSSPPYYPNRPLFPNYSVLKSTQAEKEGQKKIALLYMRWDWKLMVLRAPYFRMHDITKQCYWNKPLHLNYEVIPGIPILIYFYLVITFLSHRTSIVSWK